MHEQHGKGHNMTNATTKTASTRSKSGAKPSARRQFWRAMQYRMAYAAIEQFVSGTMWNQEAREAYLQAWKGERDGLEAEGPA
jgi:hypothetical protein